MFKLLFSFLLLYSFVGFAQKSTILLRGKILNDANDKQLQSVHVLNLNQVIGTVSDTQGNFKIHADPGDTLYFTYLGFTPLKVRVTADWINYGSVTIKMTEVGIALEQVVVESVKLSGHLELDAKNIPLYKSYRYSISGLNTAYEGGDTQPSAIKKVLGSIFNPADFLYNMFGKRKKEMRKLRKMKKDDEIRNLLETKFDRSTLSALLQTSKVAIDEILRKCNYSKDFIKFANDLQILEAISGCYESYKVLERREE